MLGRRLPVRLPGPGGIMTALWPVWLATLTAMIILAVPAARWLHRGRLQLQAILAAARPRSLLPRMRKMPLLVRGLRAVRPVLLRRVLVTDPHSASPLHLHACAGKTGAESIMSAELEPYAPPVPEEYRPRLVMNPAEAKALDRQLREAIRAVLIEGTDYGTIPGTGGGPSLWQPGAEKLLQF